MRITNRKISKVKWFRKGLPYAILVIICFFLILIGFVIGRSIPCAATKVSQTDAASEVSGSKVEESSSSAETDKPEPEPNWIEFRATAYCPCEKCCGKWAANRPVDSEGQTIVYTASGARAVQGVTVAADWSVLPVGTVIEIEDMGTYIVQDRGGAIGGNSLDIYFSNHNEALDFGVQTVRVRIVEQKKTAPVADTTKGGSEN